MAGPKEGGSGAPTLVDLEDSGMGNGQEETLSEFRECGERSEHLCCGELSLWGQGVWCLQTLG